MTLLRVLVEMRAAMCCNFWRRFITLSGIPPNRELQYSILCVIKAWLNIAASPSDKHLLKIVICVSATSARTMFQKMKQFNDLYGFCLQKGEPIQKGQDNVVVYPPDPWIIYNCHFMLNNYLFKSIFEIKIYLY